jgi:hypothetical protein
MSPEDLADFRLQLFAGQQPILWSLYFIIGRMGDPSTIPSGDMVRWDVPYVS